MLLSPMMPTGWPRRTGLHAQSTDSTEAVLSRACAPNHLAILSFQWLPVPQDKGQILTLDCKALVPSPSCLRASVSAVPLPTPPPHCSLHSPSRGRWVPPTTCPPSTCLTLSHPG